MSTELFLSGAIALGVIVPTVAAGTLQERTPLAQYRISESCRVPGEEKAPPIHRCVIDGATGKALGF